MKTINIVHLYAKEMNIYGDNGNVAILHKRLQWRGIPSKVMHINVGDTLPVDSHIIIGGGGQDAGQSAIASDMKKKQKTLLRMRDDGVVMLMICGMYQMFGHYFKTTEGVVIPGLGILDAYTDAGNKRIIGNISTKSHWGTLVGYENHSGKTYLAEGIKQHRKKKIGRLKKYLSCSRVRMYVCSLCEGGELFGRLEQHGNFSENEARELFLQIIKCVKYMHSQKICHRDLKP